MRQNFLETLRISVRNIQRMKQFGTLTLVNNYGISCVAIYILSKSISTDLKGSLPTVEEIEAELNE